MNSPVNRLSQLLVWLVLLAVCGCGGSTPREKNSKFLALERGGVTYTLPPNWKAYDPPMEEELEQFKHSGTYNIGFLGSAGSAHGQVPRAVFESPSGMWVEVFCARPRPAEAHANWPATFYQYVWRVSYWTPAVWPCREVPLSSGDGVLFSFSEVHVLPGILAGKEWMRGIAVTQITEDQYVGITVESRPEAYRFADVETMVRALLVKDAE